MRMHVEKIFADHHKPAALKLSDVATMLGVTPIRLRDRLYREGTSFSEIRRAEILRRVKATPRSVPVARMLVNLGYQYKSSECIADQYAGLRQ